MPEEAKTSEVQEQAKPTEDPVEALHRVEWEAQEAGRALEQAILNAPEAEPGSTPAMTRLNEARGVLSDAARCAEYRKQLKIGTGRGVMWAREALSDLKKAKEVERMQREKEEKERGLLISSHPIPSPSPSHPYPHPIHIPIHIYIP